MTEKQSFAPTWQWHLKILVLFLLLCTVGLFCFSYIVKQLPQPYQRKVPAPETTPWLK